MRVSRSLLPLTNMFLFVHLERGEINVNSQTLHAFGCELKSPLIISKYLSKYFPISPETTSSPSLPSLRNLHEKVSRIDGATLWSFMMKNISFNYEIILLIYALRARGLLVAALTNNFHSKRTRQNNSPSPLNVLLPIASELFDVTVESCLVNLRKPDPRIYTLVAHKLGLSPSECIFLDDIGSNLKPAKNLGMSTIKVPIFKSVLPAILELEKLLSGMTLRSSEIGTVVTRSDVQDNSGGIYDSGATGGLPVSFPVIDLKTRSAVTGQMFGNIHDRLVLVLPSADGRVCPRRLCRAIAATGVCCLGLDGTRSELLERRDGRRRLLLEAVLRHITSLRCVCYIYSYVLSFMSYIERMYNYIHVCMYVVLCRVML